MQLNSVNVLGGVLSNMGVWANVSTTSTLGVLGVNFTIQNGVPVGGGVWVTVPADIVINSGVVCHINGSSNSVIYASTCTTTHTNTSTLLYIQATTQIPPSATLTLTVSPITTPISTMPTQSLTLSTTN